MSNIPQLKPDEFKRIAHLIKSITGMNYEKGKETLVKRRLASRLHALHKNSFSDYLDFVESEQSQKEMVHFIDVLTTNKTSFFRENEHFEFLSEEWIPKMEAASPPNLRLWSAACSSGQEPYSMAIHLTEKLSSTMLSRTRILATDLSTEMISVAKSGVYSDDVTDELSATRRSTFLEKRHGEAGRYRVRDSLRKLIQFQQLNLMGKWPTQGLFDVIFCRNAMIYFDKPTKENLVNRFYKMLAKGGYLLIGHAESLSGSEHPYTYIQPAVWQK